MKKVSFSPFYFISHLISLLFRADQTHQEECLLMIDCGINDDEMKSAGDIILTWKEDIGCLSAVILNKTDENICRVLFDTLVGQNIGQG